MQIEEMQTQASKAVGLLKALANENRLLILCHLQERELSVGEINDSLGLSQSALSQHLAILREKGVLLTRKDANRVYYRIGDARTLQLIGMMREVFCG